MYIKATAFYDLRVGGGQEWQERQVGNNCQQYKCLSSSCSCCSQLFSWIINNYYQMIKLQIFVNFIIINTIIIIFRTLFVFLEKTTVTKLIDSGLDSSQEAFSVRDVHCVTILQCPPCPVICKGFNLKAFQFSSKKKSAPA